MHKVMSSPTATNYRIAQDDTFRNPEKVAHLQKHFLKMKLESQIQFLQSIHRPEVQEAIDGLATYITKIDAAKDKRDLLTIESRAGYLPKLSFEVKHLAFEQFHVVVILLALDSHNVGNDASFSSF